MGPIPRSVFNDLKLALANDEDLIEAISQVMLLPSHAILAILKGARGGSSAIHRVFVLLPNEVEGDDVNYRISLFEGREHARIAFLSPLIERNAKDMFASGRTPGMAQLTAGNGSTSSYPDRALDALLLA